MDEQNQKPPWEPSLLIMPWRWSVSDWVVFAACFVLLWVVTYALAACGAQFLFDCGILHRAPTLPYGNP